MAKKRARPQVSRGRKRTAAHSTKTPGKAPGKEASARSLHIGLNRVDPGHYSGWSGPLAACEFDAGDMAALAKSQGIEPTVLLTTDATREATIAALRDASRQLKSGDLFFLSYSGHGGQVDDVSGEEPDKLDETWCLYDGELIDDELYLELSRFAKGVRVLVLSDSCHSGTVTRAKPKKVDPAGPQPRMMPPDVAERVYRDHKAFYDLLQRNVMKASKAGSVVDPDAALALAHLAPSKRLTTLAAKSKAAVILISGCQDNQTSMDGVHNGAFTEQLLKVWNKGTYRGNYTKFHAAIKGGMPGTQTPNLFQLGLTTEFAKQQPFSV